jgi:predicted phage terminase large subunit-like protein
MDQETIKGVPRALLMAAIEKELGERSLYEFFKMVTKNIYSHIAWDMNWHYKIICDKLQDEIERILEGKEKSKDIIINLPFRSGKSTLISEIFPVWVAIKSSGKLSILNICSTQALAVKSSRLSKLIISSSWFKDRFADRVQLVMDNKSKASYSYTGGGHRLAMGIDSSIIGQGADIIIIDDPNDPADNASDLALRRVISTYKDVIYSRLNNNKVGIRILLQQRIHENDLCGYLLQNNSADYTHICLPAVLNKFVTPEYIEYYEGDLFWTTRFSHSELLNYQKILSNQAYASQLMQSPSALEGDLIKRSWFKIITQLEFALLNRGKMILFVDTSYTDNRKNDPTAILLCTVVKNNIYILKAEEFWKEFYEIIEILKEWAALYNVSKIYIEPKASGLSIIQELKRQIRGTTSVMKIDNPTKSKIERVNSISPYLNNGRVILVKDNWNEVLLNQISAFPFGLHDDLVDTLTYSVKTLIAGRYQYTPKEYNPADEKDDFDLYA